MKKFTQIIDQQKALELTSTEKPKLTLCLTMDERTKSRLKVALSDGQEARRKNSRELLWPWSPVMVLIMVKT